MDVLAIILSGFEGDRIDRGVLTEVLHGAENPSEGEAPEILKGRGLTGRVSGLECKPLSVAWVKLSQYMLVEPVGYNDHYLLGHGLKEIAASLRTSGRVSEKDYEYLTDLKVKYIMAHK